RAARVPSPAYWFTSTLLTTESASCGWLSTTNTLAVAEPLLDGVGNASLAQSKGAPWTENGPKVFPGLPSLKITPVCVPVTIGSVGGAPGALNHSPAGQSLSVVKLCPALVPPTQPCGSSSLHRAPPRGVGVGAGGLGQSELLVHVRLLFGPPMQTWQNFLSG